MLDSYRRALARPGALPFSAAGLIARLPISMVGLGIVLLVSARTGSYGLAGAVSAAFVLAQAAFALWHGRWVDSWGQAKVLPWAITLSSGALSLMVLSVEQQWPTPATYALAAVAGASLPQVGACVRSRWAHLLDDPGEIQTAFALEAVLDEVVFMVGPVLVTVLATTWHPVAGLAVAVTAGLVGTWVFALQRTTEPPATGARRGDPREPMPWMLVLTLALVCLMLGALFGAAEVATVALADEQGARWASGLLLATWALGSLTAGVATGAIQWRRPPGFRLRMGSAALALAVSPLLLVDSLGLMAVLLLVGGMAIAPTLISTMTMVEAGVHRSRLTEGMAVLHTGMVAGVAPGSGLAGLVIDEHGASAGYAVVLAAGVLAAVIAQMTRRAERPRAGAVA